MKGKEREGGYYSPTILIVHAYVHVSTPAHVQTEPCHDGDYQRTSHMQTKNNLEQTITILLLL